MPIYFGYPATDKRNKRVEVSDKLKEKGIELLRAPPSKIRMIVLPFANIPVWHAYVNSFPALIKSINEKAPVPIGLEGYDDITRHPRPFPLDYPDLCLGVSNLNPTTTKWLADNGFEEQTIRNETSWLLHNPRSRDLRHLAADDCPLVLKPKIFSPVGYVNFNAAGKLAAIVSLMSWTAQCLSITVFDKQVGREILTADIQTPEVPQDGGAVITPKDVADRQTERSGLESYKVLLKVFENTDLSNLPDNTDVVDAQPIASNLAYYSINDLQNDTKNPGGVLLRFVDELSDEDHEGVPNFITKYALRSLGADLEEILDEVDEIRSAWGVIRSTRAGHVLSHIAKAMEIAIDSNCAVRIIFENNFYEGTVIYGRGFSISFNGNVYQSKNTVSLNSELALMETHSRALQDIMAILYSGEMEVDNRAEIRSMAALRVECLNSQLSEDDRTKLIELARKLRFGKNKLSVNMGNINWLLGHVLDGSIAFGSDDPLSANSLFCTDKLEVAMSCFPENSCPSFRHPSGVPIKLTSDKAPSPPKDQTRSKGTGANAGQINNGGWIFTIRRVAFKEAVTDFTTMMKLKEARSTSSAVARQMGNFVLSGANFESIFQKLKQCTTRVDAATGVNAEVIGSNAQGQKRELSAADAGQKTKKPRNYF
jgi:hypothetical protein